MLGPILAEPKVLGHRLAMADFLEEGGETDRATLIRIQMGALPRPNAKECLRLAQQAFRTFEPPISGPGTIKVLASGETVKYRVNGRYMRLVLDRGFVGRVDGIAFGRWINCHEELTAQTPVESVGFATLPHALRLEGHGWRLTGNGMRYHKDTDHMSETLAIRHLLARYWPKIVFNGPGIGDFSE